MKFFNCKKISNHGLESFSMCTKQKMWPLTCMHYIAMFLNSCHCIKTLHITLNKVWKNTTIELLKTFSDPQITKELMHLNNSFWRKTGFSSWKQQAMKGLRTIMNVVTVQNKATALRHAHHRVNIVQLGFAVHILWRKMANESPDASVANIILNCWNLNQKHQQGNHKKFQSDEHKQVDSYKMLQVLNDLAMSKNPELVPWHSYKTMAWYFTCLLGSCSCYRHLSQTEM